MHKARKVLLVLLGILLVGTLASPTTGQASTTKAKPTTVAAYSSDPGRNVTSTAAANRYSCSSVQHFFGTVYYMARWLRCGHIPYVVYTYPGSTKATKQPDITPEAPRGPPMQAQAAGGPPCQWAAHHIVEICYHRGVPSLLCMQWWHGDYYPYHCGPAEAYNISHSESMWSVIKHLFKSHFAQACTRGAVASGVPGAVLLKVAGKATGIGVVANLAAGCVGGVIYYYWHVP